jgi:hypothetical protein
MAEIGEADSQIVTDSLLAIERVLIVGAQNCDHSVHNYSNFQDLIHHNRDSA